MKRKKHKSDDVSQRERFVYRIITQEPKTRSPKQLTPRLILAHQRWLRTNGMSGKRAEGPFAELWVDLSGVDLRKANLQLAVFTACNFDGADFRGANLRRADMPFCSLVGAKLDEADLTEATLDGVRLSNASLVDAKIDRANIFGVDFTGANLSGATLRGALLDDHDLDGSISNDYIVWIYHVSPLVEAGLPVLTTITQDQLNQTVGDEQTRLPEGLTIRRLSAA